MAPHSSTLAWKIPWMEEPGGLWSMGSLRVGHNRATSFSLFTFLHWRRQWQPTPVFLPGESQRWQSLVGLMSMGSHRVGHDWSDLAAAAADEATPCDNNGESLLWQRALTASKATVRKKVSSCCLTWALVCSARQGFYLEINKSILRLTAVVGTPENIKTYCCMKWPSKVEAVLGREWKEFQSIRSQCLFIESIVSFK